MLHKEEKAAIFKKYGKSEKDTGSTEGQIALFTKINIIMKKLLLLLFLIPTLII